MSYKQKLYTVRFLHDIIGNNYFGNYMVWFYYMGRDKEKSSDLPRIKKIILKSWSSGMILKNNHVWTMDLLYTK